LSGHAVVSISKVPRADIATGYQTESEPIRDGYKDFYYGNTPHDKITAEKPESKIWWNDGIWWGTLWDPDINKYRIHRLDENNQNWVNVGPEVDDRNTTLSDALWDGQKLYIVSHVVSESSDPSRLYRYSYDAGTKSYSYDFPSPYYVEINNRGSEALTIAKDSEGKLWITWEYSSRVYVNRTTVDDLTWGEPFILPALPNPTRDDDISAVIAFGGNKIGIMWSDQSDRKIYFAYHLDGTADKSGWVMEVALADGNLEVADDHINMKTDVQGNVYAVTKTSLSGADSPKIYLNKRDVTGQWSNHVVSRDRDDHTRPCMVIDEENRDIYVFAPSDAGDLRGTLYMKQSDLDNINFANGVGTPFIQYFEHGTINDPTSTKQNVNGATNLLVLASDKDIKYYSHNYLDLDGIGQAPDIAVDPTSYDYGDVDVGANAQHIFVVSNEGQQNLTVSVTSLGGDNPAEFSISNGEAPFTVAPGNDRDIVVEFSPSFPGQKTATLTIVSNDPDESPFAVELSGRGLGELLGDVNDDGLANSNDALILISCDIDEDVSQHCPLVCGDVNEDGLVNSFDALVILAYDAGISVPFPVAEAECPASVTPCPGCEP